jgi:hypothetical protein
MQLESKNIAILATNGFEQSELDVPRDNVCERSVPDAFSYSHEGWIVRRHATPG